MANTLLLTVENQNPTLAIRNFLKSVLHDDTIQAILVPARQEGISTIMPCLIHDPALLDQADPLAPFFPLNAARLAARLSVKPVKGKMAFVLRPCEIRALVELEKLKQADLENCLLISMDCAGAYAAKAEVDSQDTIDIPDPNDAKLAPACRACEHFVPENADLIIGWFGVNPKEKIMIQAGTDAGMAILEKVARESGQPLSEAPSEREKTVAGILDVRMQFRDAMFAATRKAVDSHEKFTRYFERCINCYNCRVACPVCYCRECVFNTDVFDHEPFQYLQWARRKGAVKLPADTVFYHMTRLAHMSLSCVGCGQCSNACPNDIPVMELFRTTAFDVQNAFDYEPGRDRDDPLPLSVFREKEFTDVVGID
ncbi:MAG: 4Fe-4S dicluster domain-containing protein [Desulfobacterales bacterium]